MSFNLVNESIFYDDFKAIDSLTLNIKKGEKVALLGKSGSGKSTLLKRMFELQKEFSSYIPQELGLVNNLSVFHNVYISKLDSNSLFYNIRNFIIPCKTQVSGISNILKDLMLDDKLFVKSLNLSGGQRQRVAIARAMYGKNEILLADEPISALDEFLAKKVIEKLNNSFETVVCTMHNVDLAIDNFDRVIGLKDGEILVDKASSLLTTEDRNKLYYVTK